MLRRTFCMVLTLCLLLGIVLVTPATTVSAAGQTSDFTFVWGPGNDTYYRVTKNNAPLRASASDSGKVIVRLDKGDLVKVTGTVRTWKMTLWLKVSYFGDGKVRTAYLYTKNATKVNVNINGLRDYAAELYDECNIYAEWGITKVQAMDLANTATSKSTVKNKLVSALKNKLEKAVGKSMNVSSYKDKTYYGYYDSRGIYRKNWGRYDKTGGCTWYCYNRFLKVNGSGVAFRGNGGGGNAETWDNRIDTSKFTKIKASKLANNTVNAIAVDNEGSRGLGHVVYIELVADNYVYYSHGWYSNGRFSSRLEKKKVEDFAKIFETVLLPK